MWLDLRYFPVGFGAVIVEVLENIVQLKQLVVHARVSTIPANEQRSNIFVPSPSSLDPTACRSHGSHCIVVKEKCIEDL